MDRIAGPVIALVLIIAIGIGVYAYTLQQRVMVAEAEVAVAQKRATTAEQASQDVEHRIADMNDSKTALGTCQTQLQDATKRADAAEQSAQTRNAGGKRR